MWPPFEYNLLSNLMQKPRWQHAYCIPPQHKLVQIYTCCHDIIDGLCCTRQTTCTALNCLRDCTQKFVNKSEDESQSHFAIMDLN